jgi:hypothetical protein
VWPYSRFLRMYRQVDVSGNCNVGHIPKNVEILDVELVTEEHFKVSNYKRLQRLHTKHSFFDLNEKWTRNVKSITCGLDFSNLLRRMQLWEMECTFIFHIHPCQSPPTRRPTFRSFSKYNRLNEKRYVIK